MAVLGATQLLLGLTAVLTIAVLAYRTFISTTQSKHTHPLPPGPKPKFLLGNIADLPPAGSKEWLHWLKLKDQYGPISSLTVLGQTMVIISDYKLAVELMEKRSTNASSRPTMEFGAKMC